MRKFKQRHRHHRRGAFKKTFKQLQPNAIFGSKSGPINLDLSVVCSPDILTVQNAHVQATSKCGDIEIRVVNAYSSFPSILISSYPQRHIHTRRRLNLEVSSRKGRCIVFGHPFMLTTLRQCCHFYSPELRRLYSNTQPQGHHPISPRPRSATGARVTNGPRDAGVRR